MNKITRTKRVAKRRVGRSTKAHDAGLLGDAAQQDAEGQTEEERVSMTLGQLCALLGQDIESDNFASTALASFADQLETIAVIVDTAPDFSQCCWRLFQNLAERAKYAGEVVSRRARRNREPAAAVQP